MAFRWRADDGPTLNAGFVALRIWRISEDPVQSCEEILYFCDLSGRGGGSGPPNPPLDPRMGPANVYTYWDILKPHPVVRIGICTTLLTFYRMRKFLNWRNILFWIPFGSDLDPNSFCKCKERERERERGRLVHANPFGKIKVHRRIEVCVCVSAFALESVLVFWSKRKCSDSLVVRDEWT